ncbi:hydroxymethylpyrimidine/phosphomethylpyrimidine kinase [Kineosphaera limosa]|uniref:Phosphomethylpyrimidine kinase n=1 Tax=Kineosphaera limosa NBRC 100340 TaxID=1184609 RepID=K6WTV8_9MICO|nr:bifunctional hydroxymethylpyrimidine kinase/phosphomethylpyrimidine kinase [Kineosphaera limosa]NYD99916.1 hydroxymethylpyrimidine/phosphomethylpyrimidine kinase [Kineosphaera limosa]GAB95547.1 phosphomethylpyrimidine kinase [Kineosphaera limosa NBRC 100340]
MTDDAPPISRPAGAPPIALSIAGSDPSGGAGIQADLKTFSALGAYGTAAITALTAQNTRGVTGVHVVPPGFVTAQLDTLAADLRIDAIKIGMLADAAIAGAVGEFLRAQRRLERPPYIVLDPVMVATSGDRLLDEAAVDAVRDLLPLADLVTPNLPEAAVLLDVAPAGDLDGLTEQARALARTCGTAVLVKGGHGVQDATDVLAEPATGDGTDTDTGGSGGEQRVTVFEGERIETSNTHGTGCTLSSALAALRPQRDDWPTTVRDAKTWLSGALAAGDTLYVGSGSGPVHHFHEIWRRP